MQDLYPSPSNSLSGLTTTALLAGALLVTGAITAGVAALYSARPADPSALLSAEHTPLVVTATRLKGPPTASPTASSTASSAASSTPSSPAHRPKPECQSIAC